MSDLTFVGLASYSDGATNLVNVIFTSNQTTTNAIYYSQVTNSAAAPAPPTPGTPGAWSVIPNIPVNIPANTEISAQLTSNVTADTPYYVYIVSSVTNTIIWQTSTPANYTTTNNFTTVNDYTTNSILVTTTGGYILLGQTSVGTTIQSNVIYTNAALTINILDTNTYTLPNPLFIMSQTSVIISGGTLNTTDGSINIVGTTTTGTGINITDDLITSGTVTLNGTSTIGYSIIIGANVTNNGAGTITLNGIGTTGRGIYIGIAITFYGIIGTITLNGTATGTGGRGISINGIVTNNAYSITLNGTATGDSDGIRINADITNNGIGVLTLNGTATGGGKGISIGTSVTFTGITLIVLNGSTTTGYNNGINIGAQLTILSNVILNGTANTGNGINIGAQLTISSNVILTGIATGTDGNGIIISAAVTNAGTDALILNGTATATGGRGIYINGAVTNNGTGTITLNGTAPGTSGIGIYITLDVTFTDAVTLNITTNSTTITGNIVNHATITGLVNIGINPTSNLSTTDLTYNNGNIVSVITGILSSNINNTSGSYINPNGSGTVNWKILQVNPAGTWQLSTGNACLLVGTMILTPSGEISIENIKAGHNVITADNRVVTVLSTYHNKFTSGDDLYVIRRNAVDINIPNKDLYLSKGHIVNIHGKYVHPFHDKSNLIEKCDGIRELDLYHLELENYMTDYLVANGLEVESFGTDIAKCAVWKCDDNECKLVFNL